jgi:hypothetical protein
MIEKLYKIRVTPRAKENKMVVLGVDELKVWLTAPPLENKATFALIEFLAESLGVKRNQISLVSGVNSRNKIVKVVF